MNPRVALTVLAPWWLTLAALSAEAAVVTRGPYLQMGTPTSVVIRWSTDVATNSRVSYGSAPGSLTMQVNSSATTTNHQLTVSGLSPDKVYYYAVGTSAGILAGNDASHFFVTAPAHGTPKAMRIWVLGDSGTANSNARAVRDAYYTFTGTRHTNLWLMLGDNAYPDGTDSEYQAALFDMYPEMLRKSVLWPTLGNHDGHTADSATQSGPYYDIFTLPRNAEAGGVPSGTEAYYSFDHGNVHFIVLDSFESDRSPGGAMLTWLTQDLQATTQDWIIAYWHHPPLSKGSHDSDTESALEQMRQNALPILEDGGVDLVLSGHSHSYERSFLLDRHYGTSDTLVQGMVLDGGDGRPTGDGAYQKATLGPAAHEGAVYTVAGTSGHTGGGSLDHPAMFISLNVLGCLVVDVQGNRLDGTFLESTSAVRDTFTILKGAQPRIMVKPTSGLLTTEAGGTATFTVVLDSTPAANVSIGLSSSDTTEGSVSPSSLTFSPANALTPQIVTVRGVNDTLADGTVAYTVLTAPAVSGDPFFSGHNAADVAVRNADDETAGGGVVFEKRVAAGADDAEQNLSTGGVSLSSSDLELVQDAGANQAVGIRFTGVAIPKGASIVNAWVQFKADQTGSSATSVSIQGEAADNAATFTTSANNVTSRPRTVASVGWAPTAWTVVGEAGAAQRTPNLASVIQQIVNRAGWVSGNSLVLIITGTGTRTADSYEGGQAAAPLLHVEYGGGNQPPSVSAGSDQTVTLPASANLSGSVSDDGQPGPLTTVWSKLSGPGTVTFGNASVVATTASFSVAGSYTLRLTANDGAVSVFDDVVITVLGAAGQATLSVLKKGVIHSATDAAAYSFPSITAVNGRLYVVFVNTSIGTGAAPWANGISGAGLTFSEVGTPGGVSYSGSTGVRRIQVWRALASAGATSGAIAISLSGTSTAMDAVLLEFGGVDTSGTNGAGAIAQSAFGTAQGATSLSIALTPLASPNDRPVAFFTHRAAEATTEAPGYTELDDAAHSSPVTGVECQWHASSANNAPSASWSTAADAAGVVLEIKAAP